MKEPTASLNVPLSQVRQLSWRASGWYVPIEQAMHANALRMMDKGGNKAMGDSTNLNHVCTHKYCSLHCRRVPFVICVAAGGTGLAGSTRPLFTGRASLAFAVGIVQRAAYRTASRCSHAAEGPVCTIDAGIETCEFFKSARRTKRTIQISFKDRRIGCGSRRTGKARLVS